jgi:hypothetical protein
VDVTLRLWQVILTVVVVALAAGLMLGRYTAPKHHAATPHYFGVNVGGFGTIYLPSQVEADAFKAAYVDRANSSAAQANVRAAVPAIEAYNADHSNGYTGVTLRKLQTSYDAGVKDISIVWAGSDDYCIESTVGSATYHKAGPVGDIVAGPCP